MYITIPNNEMLASRRKPRAPFGQQHGQRAPMDTGLEGCHFPFVHHECTCKCWQE